MFAENNKQQTEISYRNYRTLKALPVLISTILISCALSISYYIWYETQFLIPNWVVRSFNLRKYVHTICFTFLIFGVYKSLSWMFNFDLLWESRSYFPLFYWSIQKIFIKPRISDMYTIHVHLDSLFVELLILKIYNQSR